MAWGEEGLFSLEFQKDLFEDPILGPSKRSLFQDPSSTKLTRRPSVSDLHNAQSQQRQEEQAEFGSGSAEFHTRPMKKDPNAKQKN